MSKGQCFETPAFGAVKAPKSHETVKVFDEFAVAVANILNGEVSKSNY